MGYHMPKRLPARLAGDISPRDAVVLVLGRNLTGYTDVTALYAAARPGLNGQGETPEQFRALLQEEAARPDPLIVSAATSAFSTASDGYMLTDEGIRYFVDLQNFVRARR